MPVRRRLRASLAITTAFAGLSVANFALGGAAFAQTLPVPTPVPLPIPLPVPTPPAPPPLPVSPPLPVLPPLPPLPPTIVPNDVIRTEVSTEALALQPTVVNAAGTLGVGLRANSTVIDWKRFNIPEGNSAFFSDARKLTGGQMAVLNRDLSGNVSQILGTLRSDSNVAVWVLNTSGILVGRSAVINTGSLVLSTLDIANADFLSNLDSDYRLAAPTAGSRSAITVAGGARVTLSGTNRGLVLLAPAINANGTLDAGAGDIAFVTATDVTLSYRTGSPLSVIIDRGTAVGGQAQVVQGTVTGRNALFALATQGSVTDSLLRIDASVTTAATGTRGIVLAAGALGSDAPGLLVRGDATTGSAVSLGAAGKLTSNGGDLVARATGGATLTGALVSSRDTVLSSNAATFVAGAVTAGRNYAVSGTDVTLGGATPVSQRANGGVSISATTGTVFGKGGLTLQSNLDALGDESLDLTAGGATGGIVFAPTTALLGGTARQSNVRLRTGSADAPLAIGRVEARNLIGAVGGDAYTVGLRRTGVLVLGDVHVDGPVLLEASGITAGSIVSGDAVSLVSNGALTAKGVGAVGTITLAGTGSTSIDTVVSSAGAISVDRDGAARFGELRASKNIAVGGASAPSTLDLGSVTGGGAVSLAATGAIALKGDVSGRTLSVRGGSVSLAAGRTYTSAGSIDLSAASGGLFAGNGTTLRSTSVDSADTIRLQADGSDGIQFDGLSRIVAGADRNMAVGVRVGSVAPLLLGSVDARALVGLGGVDAPVARDAIATDGPIGFRALNLRETFRATALSGDLRVDAITVDGAGQGIELSAAHGLLTAPGTLSADGAIVLVSGRDLTLDSVSSGSAGVSVTSAGALSAKLLSGPGGVAALGRSLVVDQATGGNVDLAATGGGLRAGSIDGATVALRATGEVAVTDSLRATGDYAVNGGTVSLGGTQSAGGAVDIRATSGDIVGVAGLRLTADADATGDEALSLGASGAVTLAADTGLIGGSARGSAINIASGAGLTLGAVDARSLSIYGAAATGAITTGDLELTDALALSAAGGLRTGNITITNGGVRLDAGGAVLTTGSITASGPAVLSGSAIGFTRLTANGVDLFAGTGGIAGDAIVSTGAANLTATGGGIAVDATDVADVLSVASTDGAIRLGAAKAVGDATLVTRGAAADIVVARGLTTGGTARLTSTGAIRARFITAGGDQILTAAGDLSAIDPAATIALTAGQGRTLAIDVGGAVRLGDLQGAGLTLRGRRIDVGAVDMGTGVVDVRATAGDLGVARLVRGGTVSLAASGATAVGDVTASGALTLSGETGLTLRDIGGASVAATSGAALAGRAITASGPILVTAAGPLSVDTVTTSAGGASIGSTGVVTLGTVNVAGDLALAGASALTFGDATSANFTATSTGTIVGRSVTSSTAATLTAGGALSLGALTTKAGGALLNATGNAALGAASIAGDLSLLGGGAVSVTGPVTTGGRYTLRGGSVALGGTRQQAGGAVSVTSTQGDISGAAGLSLTGAGVSLDAQGAIVLAGTAVDANAEVLALRAGSGRAITLGRINARSLGSIGASATDTLTHDGALTIDAATLNRLTVALGSNAFTAGTLLVTEAARVDAGTATINNVTARNVAIAAIRDLTVDTAVSGSELSLKSGGALSLVEGRASGSALIEATGLARLTRLSAGPSITLRAGDAEIGGVVRAGSILIENTAAATRTMRIGDTNLADGFRLSNAEVGFLEADTLSLDGGAGAVELAALAFNANAGRRRVDVMGTGVMTVTGQVSGTGAGRMFRFGGTAVESASASDLRVVATRNGGGRLAFDGADVELRANRIAVGLLPGFVDRLSGPDAASQASAMVGNSNSALYNANLGGGVYSLGAPTTVTARSLTIRYGEFALFQNTAPAGFTSGVVLGGTQAAPVQPALILAPSREVNSFALFGTINGIGGTSTALLGRDVLMGGTAAMGTTRINGCLIGSGAGCLRTVVIQPRLQVFDQSKEEVFGLPSDLTVPFDPLLGGNNEEFLIDLETLDVDVPVVDVALPVPIDSALPPVPDAVVAPPVAGSDRIGG